MTPVHYTDLSQVTFERALEHVGKGVSPQLLAELTNLLAQGKLHDPASIIAAVRRQVAQGSSSAD